MQRNEIYTILQVAFGSSKEECKKAFYRLARIHHPDKGGDENVFKKINSAYQEAMKLPDRQNNYPFEGNPFYNPFNGGASRAAQQQQYQNMSMNQSHGIIFTYNSTTGEFTQTSF